MVAEPAATPVTLPDASTDAIVLLLLLQLPPDTDSVNGVIDPAHTSFAPVMVAGTPFTDTTVVAKHPVPGVIVIVAFPIVTPFTTPVDDPTEATALLLLVHVPPMLLLKVLVELRQTAAVPLITGAGFTVKV